MDGRDWSKFLLPYQQAVEELKIKLKSLRTELKARDEYAPIEFVTGRVKRISSILEKAKRLSVPIDQIETGIEDIAGIRIMCQFVEDIHRVADMIRVRKDLRLVYEKDYITNYKDSGYRSYHIIVEYPVQTSLGSMPVLAEIQIRTLAMNFWATIEHSLNYKYREQLPEHVRERLRKAAEAAFALDREMSSIRQEIVDAQQDFEEKSGIVRKVLNDIQGLYFSAGCGRPPSSSFGSTSCGSKRTCGRWPSCRRRSRRRSPGRARATAISAKGEPGRLGTRSCGSLFYMKRRLRGAERRRRRWRCRKIT